MANDNETVEQVCEDLITSAEELRRIGEGMPCSLVIFRAKDIVAEHKRELANIREKCMHQAIVIAEGKDEEIARLKRENFDLNGFLLTEQEHTEKLNALIKELADALEREITYNNKADCIYADKYCCNDCTYQYCDHKKNAPLLKKAREMAK